MHKDLIGKVKLIQAEQLAVLRTPAKHHGLVDVWVEGLTPEDALDYLETASRLKPFAADQLTPEMLKLGAASRLFASGHLKAILPIDAVKELDAAKTLEPAAVKAKDAGIVKRLLKAKGTCQVIVLGASPVAGAAQTAIRTTAPCPAGGHMPPMFFGSGSLW